MLSKTPPSRAVLQAAAADGMVRHSIAPRPADGGYRCEFKVSATMSAEASDHPVSAELSLRLP